MLNFRIATKCRLRLLLIYHVNSGTSLTTKDISIRRSMLKANKMYVKNGFVCGMH